MKQRKDRAWNRRNTDSMTDVNPPIGLLTPEEAANYLNVSVRSLAKWRSTKEQLIEYIKIGSAVRYRLSSLDDYLARNTVDGEAA